MKKEQALRLRYFSDARRRDEQQGGDHLVDMLCDAAQAGDLEYVRYLAGRDKLSHVVDGETALARAAGQGWLPAVDTLLAAGAPVEARPPGAASPLMRAAWGGHAAVVARLLARRADPAYQSAAGDTALALAQEKGHAEVVALLEAALCGKL